MKLKLPPNTKIEVIAKRKANVDEVYSQEMELREWHTMEKSIKFEYHAYEIGFSAYQSKIKL